MALWKNGLAEPTESLSQHYLPDEVAAAARADLDLPSLAVVVRDLLEQHVALARLQQSGHRRWSTIEYETGRACDG